MRNCIINGDAVTELNKLPPQSVDLVFADPPYWMRVDGVLTRVEGTDFAGCHDDWDQFTSPKAYEDFTRSWLLACRRVLKPNGSIWVIGGMQCIYTIGAIMQELGFWFINDIIWHKKNPTPNFLGTRLNNSHETLLWATKDKKAKFTFNYETAKELNHDTVSEADFAKGVRKQMSSVWRFAVCAGSERLKDEAGNKLHSTQKPEEMLKRIVAIATNVGDLVLDPFAGTMTMGAAAKRLGRDYIMIERDLKYCLYGQKRLDAVLREDTPIATAVFDLKPVRATVIAMIADGFFTVGEPFSFSDGVPVATLLQDGKLAWQGQTWDMHSCAAKARGLKAQRLNGFAYWYVLRDGRPVAISQIREAYRQALLQRS